jgi:ectoine hydroxylase-related dioxygenase (phytanoyl-CoA dioxygenase family)
VLSADQLHFFEERGYLHLPAAIGPRELRRLRAVTKKILQDPAKSDQKHKEDFKYGNFVDGQIVDGNILCRMEYSLEKHVRYLALLGHPLVVGAAASIHRAPMVVTWEDMVIKMPRANIAVPWHQDLTFQSVKDIVFSIGLYFDSSYSDPLYLIPGSHKCGPLSVPDLSAFVRDRTSSVVELPVSAGDAVIHNVLTVHGSKFNRGPTPRRVLYFEFRTIRQILEDSPWDLRWLYKRLPYIDAARQTRSTRRELTEEDGRFDTKSLRQLERYWKAADRTIKLRDIDFRVEHDDKDLWSM